MHTIVFDKWETYGHESDPGGADFQYLLSGPSAHNKNDSGCVKFRRRRYERGVDRMITTHGKQWDIPEYILDDEAELHLFLDQFSTGFMNGYTPYVLMWGEYQ